MLNEPWARRLAATGFFLSLAAVVAGSLVPSLAPPDQVDKGIHFGAYGLLALLAGVGFPPRSALGVALALSALGVAVELAQWGFVPGRSGSVADAVTNGAGVALGCWLAFTLRRRLKTRTA